MPLPDSCSAAALQRLGYEPDAKHGLLGLVEKVPAPIGVLFHLAGDAADKIVADTGQLFPGCFSPRTQAL